MQNELLEKALKIENKNTVFQSEKGFPKTAKQITRPPKFGDHQLMVFSINW